MDAPCSTGNPIGVSIPSSRRVYSASLFRAWSLGRHLGSPGVNSKLPSLSASTTRSRSEGRGLSSVRIRCNQFVQWCQGLTRDLLSKPQPSVLQFSAGQLLALYVVGFGRCLSRTVFNTVLRIRCSRVIAFRGFL